METPPSQRSSREAHASASTAGQRAEGLVDLVQSLITESDRLHGQLHAPEGTTENLLVQVRLGVASALFTALRCKHLETAAHSFRVGLTCSSWAVHLGLDGHERDALEVAALLHDVGKIGVPDSVLLKPAALVPDEELIMAQHHEMGLAILRTSCADDAVLQILEHYPAWYDGSHRANGLQGEQLPRGARLLAIVDAFDAMTSHHLYRPAVPRERALQELFRCAGRQFDPGLVASFLELCAGEPATLYIDSARRWLTALDFELVHSHWRLNQELSGARPAAAMGLFERALLDGLQDGVVFVDRGQRIVLWNRGAEQITGLPARTVQQRTWSPALLKLTDEHGTPLTEGDCPILTSLLQGDTTSHRLMLRGRHGRAVPVNLHTLPVTGRDGANHGVVILIRDVSGEMNLVARCQSLHEQATRDPLTQIANRSEFDRVHELFVQAHQQHQLPCSLIMTDIDHFKAINDTYGHPAGDEVIKAYARLLKSSCRAGDLVARYGGEEFALLCADCDNATAAMRAEQIRRSLAALQIASLHGRPVTASFGVTAIQDGDTAETMLNRADRALLSAKGQGRNCVVQFGTEQQSRADEVSTLDPSGPVLLVQDLLSYVPLTIAWEKLRGFVGDHKAEVLDIDKQSLRLKVGQLKPPTQVRRASDLTADGRSLPLVLDVALEEIGTRNSGQRSTRFKIRVSLFRPRERRRDAALGRARQVAASFRAYMMATSEGHDAEVTH